MFQLWCASSISIGNSIGNAIESWILVRMQMANEQHQLNSHNTSDRLDSQASSDIGETWIELVLVTRLFHSATVSQCDHFLDATCICCSKLNCFTVRLFHSATIFGMLHVFVVWNFFFFFGGGGGGGGGGWGALSSNVFTVWWCILISRPPRVFRHFKRRPCSTLLIDGSFLAATKQL